MSPLEFLILSAVTFTALMGIFQVTLVQDLVTATGYSTSEVFSGIASILFLFYCVLAVFTVKMH